MSAALIVLVLAAEGVGDALVGGVGLAVDAVGVDLQQDGDAVPGAAGDLGGGHPGVPAPKAALGPNVTCGGWSGRLPVSGHSAAEAVSCSPAGRGVHAGWPQVG